MTTIKPSNAAGDASLPANTATQNLENKTDEPKPEENKTADVKKKVPLASIPATISIGLLIALLYLGGRIITAQRAGKPSASKIIQVAAMTQAPAKQPAPLPVAARTADVSVAPPVTSTLAVKPTPAAAPKPAPAAPVVETHALSVVESQALSDDDALPMITPQAGQHYIQVGALDLSADATRRFVQRLRGEKLDPHVAPGPSPELMRVLIGPFEKLDALNEKKAQLDAEGVDSFVRKY